jgi:DNA-binding transcriptional LysR family regulator
LNKRKFKDILGRMVAVVIASVMGTLGAGAVLGIETYKSAALAAVMGIAVVAESLARHYLEDGNLSHEEINNSFSKANEKKAK